MYSDLHPSFRSFSLCCATLSLTVVVELQSHFIVYFFAFCLHIVLGENSCYAFELDRQNPMDVQSNRLSKKPDLVNSVSCCST